MAGVGKGEDNLGMSHVSAGMSTPLKMPCKCRPGVFLLVLIGRRMVYLLKAYFAKCDLSINQC